MLGRVKPTRLLIGIAVAHARVKTRRVKPEVALAEIALLPSTQRGNIRELYSTASDHVLRETMIGERALLAHPQQAVGLPPLPVTFELSFELRL